ncbi:MAG: TRAP transporter small permease subunit [Phaeovulum sp.]|uniref:TRAP transporter small permease n=1 Tax=Phaeovulum sp. TaxID=2934796 RepID=UPI00273685DD|nr:TRAP transporter small permease subunit [Phaeovulum sp.]MDP3861050.1 TRAP transporter small permease subunit [Phaeovulum sp.]
MASLHRFTEAVAVLLLAMIFVAFIVQITMRYIFNWPVGWTTEVSLAAWLWLVLWGAAFCLRDEDHVKFDLLYQAAPTRWQRLFAMLAAVSIIIAVAGALPAAWDYVDFYKIKRSAVLQVRMKWVFIIYILFSVGLVARYVIGLIAILRDPGAPPSRPLPIPQEPR